MLPCRPDSHAQRGSQSNRFAPDAAEAYNQFIDTCQNLRVLEMMEAFHSFLKSSPMMASFPVDQKSRTEQNAHVCPMKSEIISC